jgi:CRP-like cAMP-binding protein
MFEVAAVDDGHVICREGEAATQAYVMADGAVDVIVGGDHRLVASMVRGSVFGEPSETSSWPSRSQHSR